MEYIALCVLIAGCTVNPDPVSRPQRYPEVSIDVSDHSEWRVLEQDTVAVLRSDISPTVVLVDWTGNRSDSRHPGFVLTHRGVAFTGRYGQAEAPFFVPDVPETQDFVWIQSVDSTLALRMQRGTYADIRLSDDPVIDTLPVVFQASVFAREPEVTLDLSGLYYILLPVTGTTLRISYINGRAVDSLHVEPQGRRIVRYYDDVKVIEVRTTRFGDWRIDTDARRLQVDIPAIEDGTNLFELDFDHSFKDKGQQSVRSVVHVRH